MSGCVQAGKDSDSDSPSSTGAGVGSLGFAFALANDLKISPAVLFFVPVDFVESDLFKVLGAAAG